jgi:hypothetical protein
MANEIYTTLLLELNNGSIEHEFNPAALQIDQSTARFEDKVLDIGTSEETISFGDISTKGIVLLMNLDSTNYVQWGPDSSGMKEIGRLNAGEWAFLRVDDGATLKMKANTASCKVRVILYEN